MRITSEQPNQPDTVIPKSKNQLSETINIDGKEERSILFSDETDNSCVGIVDMVNSTKTSSVLSSKQFCKYYSIFINSMTSIARNYDAVVVKNIGDSILFYFPNDITNSSDEYKKNCLECCFAMVEIHDYINQLLKSKGLPRLDYRVSSDFGNLMIAKSDTSIFNDIFGPSVNMCSKINHFAETNGIIIGGDFYELVKKCNRFKFKSMNGFEMGLKQNYPVYRVIRNRPSCSTIIKKVVDSNDFSRNEKTHCALAAMAIEKSITKLGFPELSYVTGKLSSDYNLSLFDCYVTPVYLRDLLKDLYGNSYDVIVNLINSELSSMSEDFSDFMSSLKNTH